MEFNAFINKYNNKFVDFDKKYGAQCTDLARTYIKEVLNLPEPTGVFGAKDWYDTYDKNKSLNSIFQKIPNTLLTVPKVGDIVLWNSNYGEYGHIAIIVSANVFSFKAFSQNDPNNSPCIIKNYTYFNKSGKMVVSGFLRIKK